MDFLVEFLESGGARIIKDPLLVEKKKDLPNVLLSPDISHLRGISPSFWIREENTIGSKRPDESLKEIVKSLSEVHPFSSPQDAPFSSDSKFIEKLEEFDAKREKDLHNVLRAITHDKKELLAEISDLDGKYHLIIQDIEYQIKKKEDKVKKLFFIYILVMILLKLL
jgi:hypothetical protein